MKKSQLDLIASKWMIGKLTKRVWEVLVVLKQMMMMRKMMRKSREKEPKEGKKEEDCPTGVSSTIL